MSQGLIFLGIFILLVLIGHMQFFLTLKGEGEFFQRLSESIWPKNKQETRFVFGQRLFRIIGIFWIFTGYLIGIIGEDKFQEKFIIPMMAVIILGPVMIGVFIAERRQLK